LRVEPAIWLAPEVRVPVQLMAPKQAIRRTASAPVGSAVANPSRCEYSAKTTETKAIATA
jgi:hypothetical protein